MASVCVNHILTAYSNYAWLSPKISDSSSSDIKPDLESAIFDAGDFEFRLADDLTMLPADELFSDGKLVPLQFSTPKKSPPPSTPLEQDVKPPELVKSCRESVTEDPCLFSPKARRCSSRWRGLLGLRKLQPNNKEVQGQPKTTTSSSSSSTNGKSIRHFLNKNSKTSGETSLTWPLLKDSSSSSSSTEYESVSISLSRVSLDELPRQSLKGEKPSNEPVRSLSSSPKLQRVRPRENPHPQPYPRAGRSPMRNNKMTRGVSVDSPRMNPSGRVVFQSLERSSSSPSSFNGGPRHNYNNNNNRGMIERSYSGNVHGRVTPVLNVPLVCSLRGSSKSTVFGFTQFFSSSHTQKKDSHINSRTKHISRINKLHRDGKQTNSGKTVETSIF